MKMGSFVLGYHGCDRDVAEELLAGSSKFKASENDHDWLGHGVYFWENNPRRAMHWAQFMADHPKFQRRVKTPAVVGAVLDMGNCLDLTETTSLELVHKSYYILKQFYENQNLVLPENRPAFEGDEDLIQRCLDCAVINIVHDLRRADGFEEFQTVRGVFLEGGQLFPGSAIRNKTHIQICVRDLQNIRGVFRVDELDL